MYDPHTRNTNKLGEENQIKFCANDLIPYWVFSG